MRVTTIARFLPTSGSARALLAAALLLCAACALTLPSPAAAETVSLAGSPMEVQLWPGGEVGYTLFIVTAHLPEDVAMPATVRVPLPANSRVIWSGEILGGPVVDDPERTSSVVDVPGGFALELTAEETRTVQYEAIGPALTIVDGLTTSVFRWVQSVEGGEISFSVRLPATAEEFRIDPEPPGAPRVNEAGERLFTLRPVLLGEGQEFVVTSAYGRAGAGSGSAGGSPVPPALLGLLGVALIVLMIALFSKRSRSA